MPKVSGVLTDHFLWQEVRCNHCGKLPADLEPVEAAAAMAEAVRAILGGKPLHVNSWYRCLTWNRKVGGAENSYHMKGFAIDFTCKGLNPRKVQAILKAHWGEGKLIRGLGMYPGFTHIDCRPNAVPAIWEE